MNTVFLLLARYESPRLNVEQIADFMHVTPARVMNRIYAKDMPFPTYKEGSNHFADLNDVAAYHDQQMQRARAEMTAHEEAMRVAA